VSKIILPAHLAYRERIYIIRDLILKLFERGEMDQTSLIGFCGLNLVRHKALLDQMESNDLIRSSVVANGKKISTVYRSTHRGVQFCLEILDPFEKMFPRKNNNGLTR
jgi:predicted transcriptional regulator